jgi:hypothetical protein
MLALRSAWLKNPCAVDANAPRLHVKVMLVQSFIELLLC